LSPAWIFSVTVLAAGAYMVGLTAATTRPLTEASRTSVPRVTSAMRMRAMSTERELPSQLASSRTIRAAPAAAASSQTRRLGFDDDGAVAIRVSWPEVSGIMVDARWASSRSMQGACQQQAVDFQ
jgi:hypothetical protein